MWFLGFWHRRSKATQVDADIAVLEYDIAKERETIANLDKELATTISSKLSENMIETSDQEKRT